MLAAATPVSDPVERAIVEEALANQTDGYRMITALVRRKLGQPPSGSARPHGGRAGVRARRRARAAAAPSPRRVRSSGCRRRSHGEIGRTASPWEVTNGWFASLGARVSVSSHVLAMALMARCSLARRDVARGRVATEGRRVGDLSQLGALVVIVAVCLRHEQRCCREHGDEFAGDGGREGVDGLAGRLRVDPGARQTATCGLPDRRLLPDDEV